MNKKTSFILLSILLVGIFIHTSIALAAAAAKPKFSDVVGNPFRQQIEEVTAAGLLSGYPNGQFKPNTALSGNDGTITMLQLYITVVRSLGLENQAKNYNLAASGYSFSDTVAPEFRGYLAVAADKRLLDGKQMANLHANTVATRLNVATILATAFNITGSSDNLPFTDQDQVKESYYRSLIAGIYQQGIMSGDSNGRFNFHASMTREEYAVVLSRLLNKGLIKPQRDMVTNSRLVSYDSNSITVSENYSLTKKYSLASVCPVYVDNKAASLDQLLNKQIDFYLDGGKVTYIKNAAGSYNNVVVVTKESGRLERVTMNNGQLEIRIVKDNGTTATYTLSENVKVYQGGKSASFLDLTPDAYVQLELQGTVVRQIDVEETEEYRGVVTKVRSNSLTVEKSNGRDMEFSVDDDLVKVTMDGKKYDYDDIKVGYEVRVRYSSKEEALEIEVLDDTPQNLEGIVKSIDYSDYELTVEYKGSRKTYDVDEDVKVRGLVRKWKDIEKNHQVKLEFYRDEVVEIEVIDPDEGEFEGTVTDVDTRRERITIEKESGYEQTYDVGRKVDLEDIIIGSEVELIVEDGEVTDINVLNKRDITVQGEITSLKSSRITIVQDSGNEFTFDLARDLVVKDRKGKEIDYDDLKTKWEVELQLKRGDVVQIKVIYE